MRVPSSRPVAPLLLAVALAISGCGNVTQGKEDADRAVADFHLKFNAGHYDAIWDAGGDELKRGISREDWSALLAAVRRKLGDYTGSTTRSWNVNTRNLSTQVTLVQDTDYATVKAERTARAAETFVFAVKDGRAVLVGYNISSLDLILR